MRFFLIILALMLALDLAWWRHADRRVRPLRRSRLWRGMIAVFIVAQVFLLVWTITAQLFGPGFDQLTPRYVIATTYLWHLLALPMLSLAWILAGLLAMPVRLARWLRRERVEDPRHHVTAAEAAGAAADMALEPETIALAPSRRQLLGAAFAAAPPLLTGAAVGYSALTLSEFRINRLVVPIANLPRNLDGLTIAQVSDTHVGRFVDSKQLSRIVDATNALAPDLTLLTGDLINSAIADLPSALDGVRKLDSRFGVFCIEGNHDLFDDPFEFERRVKSAGVPLLLDESTVLNVRGVPLELLGLRWGLGGGGRPGTGGDDALALSVPRLLQKRRPDAFPILLAHHPHAFDWAAEAGIPLTLSGHTHGGQLMLNDRIGFGRVYRYWSGLYTRGASSLIVSNGVGHWFPLRVNAPAEIVHVTLRRVENN